MTELEVVQASLSLLKWIFGAMGAVATFLFGIWWKIESRQDKKIDNFVELNEAAHLRLHEKIDSVEGRLSAQHETLLGKTTDIWKHLCNEKTTTGKRKTY